MNVCIVGAGQLGSRHLQGVLRFEQPLAVFVFDVSQTSLDTAQQRAQEINNEHSVTYTSDWNKIPPNIEIAIVATNANVREQVLQKLIEISTIRYLILEKVLFQKIESYHSIGNLLQRNGIATWVNHPRRMSSKYAEIKNLLASQASEKVYSVAGGNWGLGCNGLHLVDLFVYLDGSPVKSIDFGWLDEKVYESKRAGFSEFTGSITGVMKSGSKFIITSFQGEVSPLTLSITTPEDRFLIWEGNTGSVCHLSKQNNGQVLITPFPSEFQSVLTRDIVSGLIGNGTTLLPTFQEASHSHILFVEGLLDRYNKIVGSINTICPIT